MCDFSVTFFVGEYGIYWEYVEGGHHILTQGFYDSDQKPIFFSFDFEEFRLSKNDSKITHQIKSLLKYILVEEVEIKKWLQAEWVVFSNNYIQGYYEVISYPDQWITFNDWNTLLKDTLDSKQHINVSETWWTVIYWSWTLKGEAVIVKNLDTPPEVKDKILVCTMTSPDYLPLMKQAKAIVTQRGWVLSHAAIVCRELQLPCIVGYENIFDEINNWDVIEVDADNGVVRILELDWERDTSDTNDA